MRSGERSPQGVASRNAPKKLSIPMWHLADAWIVPAVLAPVVALGASYSAPQVLFVASQPVAVALTFFLFGLSVLLWIFFEPRETWPPLFQVVIFSLLALWVMGMLSSVVQRDPVDLTSLVAGPLLILLVLKRPPSRSVWMSGDAYAVSLLAVSLLAQIQDVLGVREMREQFWIRLPFFADFFGPIPRWEGPFSNPNIAGPVGAFLVVYGIWRSGVLRFVLVGSGALVVVIADSRTGFIAVLAPLVVLLVVRSLRGLRTSGVPDWLTYGVFTAIAAASFLVVLRLDPSLNGRIEIWNQFLGLWQENWLFGAGQTGIQEAVNSGDLPSWANHGHNLVIDVLGRFGLMGAIALLSALTFLTFLVWFDAKSGQGAALSILVMFVAAGVTEDLIDWRYLGIHYVPLLLCSMLAAQSSLPQKVQR